MAKNRKTERQLVAELKRRTDMRGGVTAFAQKFEFSAGFISDAAKGQTPITQNLAQALGYRRVIEFEPIMKKKQPAA